MGKNKKDQPVYMISIAAKLAGMHPQTLRIYERKKLVSPGRTEKSTRLYSDNDIEQLKVIQRLTQEDGVNLAGVKIIMEMKRKVHRLNSESDELRKAMEERRVRLKEEIAKVHKSYKREIVLMPKGEIIRIRRKGGTS